VLADVAAERLAPTKLKWKRGASACVVLASGGYPGKFETGIEIKGLSEAEQVPGVKVLHAGTRRQGDALVTSGGRVLGVAASGDSLSDALQKAYQAAAKIHFDRMHYRTDIGQHHQQSTAADD